MAGFNGAAFSDVADFGGAIFSDVAEFVRAAFSRGAIFKSATFKYAIFKSAVFLDGAKFADATFQGLSLFVDAKMKTSTSFEGATFKTVPPQFFGVELHEGTVWPAYKYWPTPKKGDKVQEFVRAYECLKAEMDRLKRHEDELDFFALELQSRVLLGRWEWGLPIALYGLLSDYGRSYRRPLGALFVVAAFGAGAFWYFDARTYGEALGLSAANTLNVFGFRRDFGLAIDTPFACLSDVRRSNHLRHHSPLPLRPRHSQQIPHEMSRGGRA
ncbi:MAG: pentapeptide repeat-containing protein [Pseudomonadota bacterium]|nr:pentapeptide repeat-containing protein [Pseudomonadota bacterium]